MVQRQNRLLMAVVVLAGLSLVLWGCPKKSDMTSSEAEPTAQAKAAGTEAEKAAEMQAADAAAAQAKQAEEEMNRERSGNAAEGLQPIHFDFDQAAIRGDARTVLKANAEWLRSHASAKIRIEGNCDERGTIEYNQALGQRRAQNAKKYLVDLGVASSRIALLSYGKEKQICADSTEDCWQQNRRGDFVVTAQ